MGEWVRRYLCTRVDIGQDSIRVPHLSGGSMVSPGGTVCCALACSFYEWAAEARLSMECPNIFIDVQKYSEDEDCPKFSP
jgi:hypothetical protein